MKPTQNLVGMWLHRGSKHINNFVSWIWINLFVNPIAYVCSISSKQTLHKIMNRLAILLIIFILGILFGQNILMNKITDDCRILRATRFGEVYISCSTVQVR